MFLFNEELVLSVFRCLVKIMYFCSYLSHKGRKLYCCVMSKKHGRHGSLDQIAEKILQCFHAEASSSLSLSSAEVSLVGKDTIKSSLAHGSTSGTLSTQC